MDCEKVRGYMAEYIEETLESSVREEVACHLDMCDSCFREIKNIDKTIWNLEESSRNVKTPPGFLYNMDEEILKKYNPRAKAFKRMLKRAAYVFAVLSAVLIVILAYKYLVPLSMKYRMTNIVTMGKAYSYSDGTFGRKLNISSTSQNIKVTVEKVAADSMQTMIYFKTEGPKKEKYTAGFGGYSIKGATMRELLPYEDGFMLCLSPIYNDEYTLDISFSKMHLNNETEGIISSIKGTWSFKVPVRKMACEYYSFYRNVNIDGYDIWLSGLIMGPTGTKLDVSYKNRSSDVDSFMINGAKLQVRSKKYKSRNMAGTNSYIKNDTGGSFSLTFDAIYPEPPQNLGLNITSYQETLRAPKPVEVPIDLNSTFPVRFDYLGSTITIDNFYRADDEIQLDVSEPLKSRKYGRINFSFMDIDKSPIKYRTIWNESVATDSNGIVYDRDDVMKDYEKFKDKILYWYPVKTAVTLIPDNKDITSFILEVFSHTNFKWINEEVQLK